MSDLENFLDNSLTLSAIYEQYKKNCDSKQPRGYLGASEIGNKCDRYLWYLFRFCCKPEFSGRMYRLFETGEREEERLIANLRSIGCTVHDRDDKGEQFEVNAIGGHFSGHMDGCGIGVLEAPKTWHVLEFKTHNTKSFNALKNNGVQKAHPKHYCQMMVYMGLTGMTRALYLAVNKETDDIYPERVKFNKEEFDILINRADRIIKNTSIPERISERSDYYECKYCSARELCFGIAEKALPIPEINCRQCCHATPTMDGKKVWVCEKHKRGLSEADQLAACDYHLCLPGLISFATPCDGNEGWIEFKNNDEQKFWHGNGKGMYSTKELMEISIDSIFNKQVNDAKDIFGAVVINESNILDRYPLSDSRRLWEGKGNELSKEWEKLFNKKLTEEKVVSKEKDIKYDAVEFVGGRVAIVWKENLVLPEAEIRVGIE